MQFSQSLLNEYSHAVREISLMGLSWNILVHSVFTFAPLDNSQSISIIAQSHQELHIASHTPAPSHQPSEDASRDDSVRPSGMYDK